MRNLRWLPALLGGALVALLVGGAMLGTGLADQHDERVALNRLRIANDNLQLVVQARTDEARGHASLALTSAEDADLAGTLDELVRLDPSTESQVEQFPEVEARVTGGAGSLDERDLFALTLALNRLEDDTLDPAQDRVDAAVARTWWSFWSTGGLLAALLTGALVVGLRGRVATDR